MAILYPLKEIINTIENHKDACLPIIQSIEQIQTNAEVNIKDKAEHDIYVTDEALKSLLFEQIGTSKSWDEWCKKYNEYLRTNKKIEFNVSSAVAAIELSDRRSVICLYEFIEILFDTVKSYTENEQLKLFLSCINEYVNEMEQQKYTNVYNTLKAKETKRLIDQELKPLMKHISLHIYKRTTKCPEMNTKWMENGSYRNELYKYCKCVNEFLTVIVANFNASFNFDTQEYLYILLREIANAGMELRVKADIKKKFDCVPLYTNDLINRVCVVEKENLVSILEERKGDSL